MLEWRIYYSDGKTFDSAMGPPHEVPGYGVQCVVQFDRQPMPYNVGRVILTGFPVYYFNLEAGEWRGSDWPGFYDILFGRPFKTAGYCLGRTEVTYRRILNQAENDPDFPVKGGIDPVREAGCGAMGYGTEIAGR